MGRIAAAHMVTCFLVVARVGEERRGAGCFQVAGTPQGYSESQGDPSSGSRLPCGPELRKLIVRYNTHCYDYI